MYGWEVSNWLLEDVIMQDRCKGRLNGWELFSLEKRAEERYFSEMNFLNNQDCETLEWVFYETPGFSCLVGESLKAAQIVLCVLI